MSTNLEFRARETQRKRESRRHANEAQLEKGRQRFRAREKKQRRHFFVGRTTWKFCNGGDTMRNTSGHQCKLKMNCSGKKVNEKTYISSIKRVTKLEVSSCSRAKQRQRNVQKRYAARAKLLCRLSLNGHLYKRDTSVKRTPRVGPCLSLLLLFDSL